MASSFTTRIEIDAPAQRVWDILVDLGAYDWWNPHITRLITTLVVGQPIDLLERVGDGEPREARAILLRWAPGEELRWLFMGGPAWWFRGERVQRVEALGPGRCRYISEDRYTGPLAPLVAWRVGPQLQRAVDAMAAALKRRAEPGEPTVIPPPGVDHLARETFVLRGRFVAPPAAPPSASPPDELAALRAGYDRGITTYQSPTRPSPVHKARWQPCHACTEPIPVHIHSAEDRQSVAALSYVCPRCHATQLGRVMSGDTYENCHVCEASLGDAHACGRCGMLRYWTMVGCPHCRAQQPVYVPHLGSHCDVFTLECTACEQIHYSLCIC